MLKIPTTFLAVALGCMLWPAPAGAQAAPPSGAPPTGAPPAGGPGANGGFRRFREPPPNPLRNIQTTVTDDWLTYSHDPQRTGWNNGETTLTPKNVSHLKLLWSTLLPTTPDPGSGITLTAPVVVSGVQTADGVKTVAYTISGDNMLFAVDADTGKVIWQKSFPNHDKPLREANWMCTNTEQATPAIDKDKGVIYFTTSDGDLRAASLSDGSPKLTPTRIDPAYSRNWSLNVVGNWVYTGGGRGCGGDALDPMVSGNIDAADVSDPEHVKVQTIYTGFGRPDGPWNRGGPVLGPQGVYVSTADGRYDPAAGFLGESLLAVRLGGQGIADSFTPSNWRFMNAHDFDLGAGSPIIFPFKGRAIVAIGSKESVEYLLDANELGSFDHSTPLYTSPKLGNDPNMGERYGIWGGAATWEDAAGNRFLYIPMMNAESKEAPTFPHVYGDPAASSVLPDGGADNIAGIMAAEAKWPSSIMAFKVVEDSGKFSLQPVWIASVAITPDTPTVANGVVFVVSTGENVVQNLRPDIRPLTKKSVWRNTPVGHQILYAFDAETGKLLYSSKNVLKDWDHFSQPVVSDGKVYVVSHDAHLYAFGLKKR
jgi:outer membrane protein assembly factor BamB